MWFWGLECWLFLRRTWLWFLSHTWLLTIACNSISRRSNTLFWPPLAPGLCMICIHTSRQNTHIFTKLKKNWNIFCSVCLLFHWYYYLLFLVWQNYFLFVRLFLRPVCLLWDEVSHCSPGWPWTHNTAHVQNFKRWLLFSLLEMEAKASQMLCQWATLLSPFQMSVRTSFQAIGHCYWIMKLGEWF